MRYQLSEADALFVEEVQCFLKDNLDPHLARKVKYGEPVAKSEQDEWTRALNRQGGQRQTGRSSTVAPDGTWFDAIF